MTSPGYPAARAAAPKVRAHFSRHLSEATAADAGHHAPELEDIEAVVDAAFWASLRREEGYVPRISLALVAPERAIRPMRFDRRLALEADRARQGRAGRRAAGHPSRRVARGRRAAACGAQPARSRRLRFVLEVAAPGLLVIKHHRGDGGKFVNVAVLEGDQIKLIDEQARRLPDCPALLTSLLGFDAPGWHGPVNVLVDLAVSMRAHGRGGILLIVPAGESTRGTNRSSIRSRTRSCRPSKGSPTSCGAARPSTPHAAGRTKWTMR